MIATICLKNYLGGALTVWHDSDLNIAWPSDWRTNDKFIFGTIQYNTIVYWHSPGGR